MNSTSVFQFLRGALRGTWGKEDLGNTTILFVGMNPTAQQVLGMLGNAASQVYFQDTSLLNYRNAYLLCDNISPWLGESADITLNFEVGFLSIKNKVFYFVNIGDNPYTQGIHEYYL